MAPKLKSIKSVTIVRPPPLIRVVATMPSGKDYTFDVEVFVARGLALQLTEAADKLAEEPIEGGE